MSPSKLIDTQLMLLSAASRREDGALDLAGNPVGQHLRRHVECLPCLFPVWCLPGKTALGDALSLPAPVRSRRPRPADVEAS